MDRSFVSFVKCKKRLILGEGAYTFYGFSYFFLRQTLKGGREMELKKGEIHSQQQPNNHRAKHIFDKMSICAEVF